LLIYNFNQLTDIQNTIGPKFDERAKCEVAEDRKNFLLPLQLNFYPYIFLNIPILPLIYYIFFMIFFQTFYFNIFWTQITDRNTFISVPVSIKNVFYAQIQIGTLVKVFRYQ
jgi:hypothetical protein